jgi:hypothetical protein
MIHGMNSHHVLYLSGDGGRKIPVYISKILLMRYDDPYCYIYTEKQRYMERKPLHEFVAKCSVDPLLLKIHRSFMIRFDADNGLKAVHSKKYGRHIEIADALLFILRKHDEYFKDITTLPASPEGVDLLFRFEPAMPPR